MRQWIQVGCRAVGLIAVCVISAAAQAPAAPSPATSDPAPQAQAAPAQAADATVTGGKLHGVVKSGNVPLPGVTVTAQNTLTGKRYATTTDATGAWSMMIPQNGRYVIRTQFAAFAQGSQEALFNATGSHDQAVNFDLTLASRAVQQEQQAQTGQQQQIQQVIRQLAANGAQSLSLISSLSSDTESGSGGASANGGAVLPSIAGNSDFSSESVSINGQSGQVSPIAGLDMDRIRDAIETARAQGAIPGGGGLFDSAGSGGFGGAFGGSFVIGGPGGGPGGPGGPGGFGGRGGGGRGNFRGFNPGQPHGAIFWFGTNSALNAEPFSVTGGSRPQPSNGSNRFGLTFMSAPYIPGLTKPSNKDTIFLTLSGQRSSSLTAFNTLVPTDEQRAGDLGNGLTVTPVPQAVALLKYVPEPNVPLSGGNNYYSLATAQTNSTQLGVRYMRSIGSNASPLGFGGRGGGGGGGGGRRSQQNQGLRQSVNFNYNWSGSAADSVGIVPILGGKTDSNSQSLQAGYTIGYHKLTNIFNVNWNRTNTSNPNYFTNGTDIASQMGILGPDGEALNTSPLNYGVPNVNVSGFNNFISEVQPTFSIAQTISLSETLSWIHGKHNLRFGGDYRRVHRDFLGQGNATGSFEFTGQYHKELQQTDQALASLADFLAGEPTQTSISASDSKTYLRDNVYDLYANDDWRVRPSLTLQIGVRYDFYAPYTEKYNHLAMVDTNPGGNFTSVGQVSAGTTSPNYGSLPDSLVYPYRIGFSPRLGIAWRVPKIKQMVVRAGYGINYTVGEYSTFAQSMAYQPPFVNEQSNICSSTSTTPCYTLANGFSGANPIGTYALDPHYRLPHVQAFNLDIQKTLPWGIVMNLGYNGSIGGNMDIKIAPRAVVSSPNTNLDNVPFYYLEDGAFYHMNEGTVRVNKRLTHGIALGANYQWMHAIDNSGGVGGNSPLTAQSWQDIGAEVSNSTIDQRHKVSGTYLYELPFGKDKWWFTTGTASHVLEGFSISGSFTFATGSPLNVTYFSTALALNCGTAGTLRPNIVPGVSPTAGGGSKEQWFNTSAFTTPASTGEYCPIGNAPRNVLMGPGTVSNNMSLSKTLQLGDTRSWEFRATAQNAFNTVQYSTVGSTYGTSTFGQVISASSMRSFQFTTRFRF